MRRNFMFRKFVTFVLLAVMLSIALNRFNDKLEFFNDFQNYAFHKAFLVADEDGAAHGLKDLKKPSYSASEYVSICGSLDIFPDYSPLITSLVFGEPFRTVPEVYLDIVVPPDIAA